jgi:ubiquinone/menaquinone biosynthesis C-methylase UbiE
MGDTAQGLAGELPSHYPTVAQDMLDYAGHRSGIWMDLGSGSGGIGIVLAREIHGVVILVDPNSEVLSEGLSMATASGLHDKVVAVVGSAENIPLPDCSVDVVVSRGSIFFWENAADGIREVHRVLRPRGKAMIGGGLGSGYPEWARCEFVRRRTEGQSKNGPEAKRFKETRSAQAFHSIARGAGLKSFEIIRDDGLSAEESADGFGIWLRFSKEV